MTLLGLMLIVLAPDGRVIVWAGVVRDPGTGRVIEVDMDDRQTKIREGAGLEDSRINQEFLDFLNKWSSPVLIVLAVAALIWAGLTKLEQMKNEKIDNAFGELEAAMSGGNPAPTSLTTIADASAGIESVSELARLRAIDIYLASYTLGLEPGAQLNPQTLDANPEDVLNQERREQFRSLAELNAQRVLESSEGEAGKSVFAMQALSRLASIEESKGSFDAAKEYYERLASLAVEHQYPSLGVFAEARIAGLDLLGDIGTLPSANELPALISDLGGIDTLIMPEPGSDASTDNPVVSDESGDTPESAEDATNDEPAGADAP
jgi:hypothetical protein